MDEHVRRYYGLLYVNGQEWLARFGGRWGRTREIGAAMLFATAGAADVARQALFQECDERIQESESSKWPERFWWDVRGGCVVVKQIEVVMRAVEEPAFTPPAV